MLTKKFLSINKVKIRLTSERLNHILTNHPEMIEFIFDLEKVISQPDLVLEGKNNEFIAIRSRNKFYLVVIYKESKKINDGFVITAFKTKNINYFLKKKNHMEEKMIFNLQNSLPNIFSLMKSQSNNNLVINYDKEADVLYVSFGDIKKADDTEIYSNDVLLRKRGRKIIGITVLHASTLLKDRSQ